MGNGFISNIWFGDFAPKAVPLGNARGGQRRYEILKGVNDKLWKREPHQGVGPY
jgi:hypothetical protein